MKKIWSVFKRDVKIASKDPLAFWIFLAPLVFACIINSMVPGVNDSTVNLAIHQDVESKYIQKMKDFANVELYENYDLIEERVLRRDEVIGVIEKEGEIQLISQGNESDTSLKLAQLLNSLYKMDVLSAEQLESRLSFYSFHEKVPRLKQSLSVGTILMSTIISAMIIALGLVDEKNDKTIRAANVTPMKQTTYVLSKSIIGILMLYITTGLSLWILGIHAVNWMQLFLLISAIGCISMIVSFAVGLASDDFIEAAASIKVLMVPLLIAVLVFELVSEKWHFTMWWNPFFWACKGLAEIMYGIASWSSIGLYSFIILVICFVVFILCKKKIRQNLN